MTSEIRWSIVELLARYDLEPELCDVFVEGAFDREILTQARSNASARPTFYEIDSVDIPMQVLGRHHLSLGNKQRVIALARELEALPTAAKVTCLVDRDLDHWFGALEATGRLRWTVFCCIESHFLTAQTLSDILLVTARAKINNFEAFFVSWMETLKALFSLRLADRQLGLTLQWVSLRKYLKREGDLVRFDVDKYVVALLGSNAKASRHDEFGLLSKRWLNKLDCDIRLSARGHDYTDLLAWAVAAFGGQKEFASSGAIERLFVLLARSVPSISLETR